MKQFNIFKSIKTHFAFIAIMVLLTMQFAGCGSSSAEKNLNSQKAKNSESSNVASTEKNNTSTSESSSSSTDFDLSSVPAYSGTAYVAVNNNTPYFSNSDLTTKSFEKYSDLDNMGRCGVAYACVGKDIMPTEKRGPIGMVKPSGWKTTKYDNVDGKYLYNRCHLIGYQLTGENANDKNLITGTRYLNVDGMLPFENMVADYVKETNKHVLYRVTPIFEGNNLVASGVLMEGKSVEDNGASILFNVYCYNVQPGISINYANGDSKANDSSNDLNNSNNDVTKQNDSTNASESSNDDNVVHTYVININTGVYHRDTCDSVNQIKDSNKEIFTGTKAQLLEKYANLRPCKNCNP
ncbi:DNA-entry nuclease [Lachnospiraceae bacterium C7]|nr:DNA-entry nuclease [Lachnospiraceae bacterium C7]